MKKIMLLLLLALLVPWLTQSRINKTSALEPVHPQCKSLFPGEKVEAFANAGAQGCADSEVKGETGD